MRTCLSMKDLVALINLVPPFKHHFTTGNNILHWLDYCYEIGLIKHGEYVINTEMWPYEIYCLFNYNPL